MKENNHNFIWRGRLRKEEAESGNISGTVETENISKEIKIECRGSKISRHFRGDCRQKKVTQTGWGILKLRNEIYNSPNVRMVQKHYANINLLK